MITFSLQSGSNGNSIYVEANGVRLLFDAGISGKQVRQRLAVHRRDPHGLSGLLLSHGHADHIGCVGVQHRLFKVPVFATPATHRTIMDTCGPVPVCEIRPGQPLAFDGVTVHTIPTPHDAPESVAFVVECEGKRLGIFTDLGHPFAALARTLCELDAAYLESNYDPRMLAESGYPSWLQARIRGNGGHLSNGEAAELLMRCGRRRPKWVALAHLSEKNNHPDLALQTHRTLLGRDYPLTVASRYAVSPIFEL
jgi:phosphoribosyl 1,2-cyclic phosphodiesterase